MLDFMMEVYEFPGHKTVKAGPKRITCWHVYETKAGDILTIKYLTYGL